MIFLGNAASIHLKTWRALYARRGRRIEALFTIHEPRGSLPIERRIASGGKLSSYVLLGLRMRRLGAREVLHAHGASGYGLSAWLSGRPYVVTIYGSELLAGHGPAYSAMVRAVLRRARVITVTSRATAERVAEIDPALARKVLCFHTGVDPTQLKTVASAAPSASAGGGVRVMCLRNCAPQYRTFEILTAARSVACRTPPFTLTVPLGNGDSAYFARLQAEFQEPWAEFIPEALPHAMFLGRIRDADVCVNYPLSDQTSATLIEAVWFDRIVLTAELDAYTDLFARTVDYEGWRLVSTEADLADAFASTIEAIAGLQGARPARGSGAALVTEHYGIDAAAEHLGPLLEISPA